MASTTSFSSMERSIVLSFLGVGGSTGCGIERVLLSGSGFLVVERGAESVPRQGRALHPDGEYLDPTQGIELAGLLLNLAISAAFRHRFVEGLEEGLDFRDGLSLDH